MATLQELISQRDALDKQIEEAKNKSRSEAIATIRELMAQYDLQPKHLSKSRGSSAPSKKVAAKYRNPATGETWSGRGIKPKWLSAAMKQGKKLEDFAL